MKNTQWISFTNLLKVSALLEILTGAALIICPNCAALLLLNSEVAEACLALIRIGGFGLFSLGIACWPDSQVTDRDSSAFTGILIYNALITIYLFYIGAEGKWVGWLLWPAAALHAVLTILLSSRWRINRT